ncbi:hypothetical protein GRQ65_12930 [Nocardioides sp. YIM 123512]|uniref:Uncharacterized protein n=1 Tax=Nocardioides flavescens TaxID=2691959 RepID=A0A6L7F1P6_9ACTN|nr:hypothetical protein [Nocardioides flavescens]
MASRHLLARQGQGTHHLGARAEGAGPDLHPGGRGGLGPPADRRAHVLGEQLGERSDVAAHHEQAGVEDRDQAGQDLPDRAPRVGHHPDRPGVPVRDERAEPVRVEGAVGHGADGVQQVRQRDHRLQAAAGAAPAEHARRVHLDVAELARGAPVTAEQSPAQHQAGPDAGRQLEVDERAVRAVRPGAGALLAERAEVGVVVHEHLHSEPLPELLAGPSTHPQREDVVGRHRVALLGQGSGHTQHRQAQVVEVVAGLGHHATRQAPRTVEGRLGVRGVVERDGPLGQDPAGHVAHGDPDVGVADVDPEQRPRGRHQAHAVRRPTPAPPRADGLVGFVAYQPRQEEVAARRRDRRG